MNDSLSHRAPERWTFDAEVTNVFEDMLQRSIPQIDVMRGLVVDVAKRYRQDGTRIVDLGASRGDAVAPMLEWNNLFDLVEVSPPMAAVCAERYASSSKVKVHETDLRREYPKLGQSVSVTLSVLTLQFTPIEHRLRILSDAFETTRPGGALILVEKVLGSDAPANAMLVDLYHDLKERNGYSRGEIDRKAASLEGVLVPVTARWNEELLRGAGFRSVECFWRCLSFAAWVAVR